jgi:hypothetical protein
MRFRDLVRAIAAFSEDLGLSACPALELRSLEGYSDVVELVQRAAAESHIRTGRHISRNQSHSRCRSLSH